LFVFSFFYRKRNSRKSFEPYFPSHPERNAYITLLQKKDPPAHDVLLKSALVRRAIADVQRVLRIREDKSALQNLLQKGSVGDGIWNSLLAAEKELEVEIMEVVAEANSFVDGWGQAIFSTANEMLVNEKIRATFERMNETKEEIVAKYDLDGSDFVSSAPGADVPLTPATPASGARLALSKASNGMLSPLSSKTEVLSSDEGSIASPATPKAGKKKTKKRK